jgi:putative Mg2+ transporter-C (MgtC) family protein
MPEAATAFQLAPIDVVLRLVFAIACGGVLGFERQIKHKAAGLRTHMMVSLGAATFTLVSLHLVVAQGGARSEATRIVQGITAGIGFLGGGSIVHSHGSIEGITTASSIWVVGAIGIACGAGAYVLAGASAILAVTILWGLGAIEDRLLKGRRSD